MNMSSTYVAARTHFGYSAGQGKHRRAAARLNGENLDARAASRRGRRQIALGVELLEDRFLLATSGIVPGLEFWDPPTMGGQMPSIPGPSVAMNAPGDRVVMVRKSANGGALALCFSNTGTVLGLTAFAPTLNGYSDTMVGPVVSMNAVGDYFVVAAAVAGDVMAQVHAFAGCGAVDTEVVAASDPNTSVGTPLSVAMRGNSDFVVAWTATTGSSQEAQANTWSFAPATGIVPLSPPVIILNPDGTSRAPVVAWSNHSEAGDPAGALTTNWNVVWDGSIAGSPPVEGHFLQEWDAVGALIPPTVLAIPKTYDIDTEEAIGRFALANDPVGYVGLASKQCPMGGDGPTCGMRLRIFDPGLTLVTNNFSYPWNTAVGPCDTPPSPHNATAFPTISFDAPDNETQTENDDEWAHAIVGTQQHVEGPRNHWARYTRSAGWVSGENGTIYDEIENSNCSWLVQDMFPSSALNDAGNWWVVGWEFLRYRYRGFQFAGGWLIRAWDPPIEGSGNNASVPGLPEPASGVVDPDTGGAAPVLVLFAASTPPHSALVGDAIPDPFRDTDLFASLLPEGHAADLEQIAVVHEPSDTVSEHARVTATAARIDELFEELDLRDLIAASVL